METKQMYSESKRLGKFSWWLKLQLEQRKLTVVKLGQMSGVHPNTIHNYLSGRSEPSLYNVESIVNALGYELGVISKW